MMRNPWTRLIPALIAVALMLGAVGTASAIAQPSVDAGIAAYTPSDNDAHEDNEDEDGERGRGRGPFQSAPTLLEDVDALCVDPDTEAQSLTVLCNLYDIVGSFMPDAAQHGLARAILAHADRVTPEWRGHGDGAAVHRGRADATTICRHVARLLHADDTDMTADIEDLIERCRDVLSGDDTLTAAEICRRLQASGTAGEHPALTQRCRIQFGDGDGDGPGTPLAHCRRLLASGELDDHPELAERCSNLLTGDGDGPGNPLAHCRRLLASGELDDHPELAERCSNLIDGDGDGARVRPGRPRPSPQAAP